MGWDCLSGTRGEISLTIKLAQPRTYSQLESMEWHPHSEYITLDWPGHRLSLVDAYKTAKEPTSKGDNEASSAPETTRPSCLRALDYPFPSRPL